MDNIITELTEKEAWLRIAEDYRRSYDVYENKFTISGICLFLDMLSTSDLLSYETRRVMINRLYDYMRNNNYDVDDYIWPVSRDGNHEFRLHRAELAEQFAKKCE